MSEYRRFLHEYSTYHYKTARSDKVDEWISAIFTWVQYIPLQNRKIWQSRWVNIGDFTQKKALSIVSWEPTL